MNLAAAATEVEAALADTAREEDPAIADSARETEAATASPAEAVEPATVYCPLKHAPPSVLDPNAKQQSALSAVTLRREAAFESSVAFLKGAPSRNILQKILPCIYGERDFVSYGEAKKYCLIKGETCFIYLQEDDASPLYAIPLEECFAILENPEKLDKCSVTVSPQAPTNKQRKDLVTVLLKYKMTNQQAYQFTFDTQADKDLAKRFVDIVEKISTSFDKQPRMTDPVPRTK